MENKRKENAVRSLISLYTVIIGVALSSAVFGLIDPSEGLESVTLPTTLLFVAFVATLFPFYHGALRHLDDAYLENDNPHIKDGALVVDFVLLFLHALAFVVLSRLLKSPGHFAWVLIGVLAIDVVWGAFAHFGSSSKGATTAESKWALINFVFVGAALIYLVGNDIYLVPMSEPVKLAVPIVVACLLRTIADYSFCRSFYFPK
jgi:hypothetical protein